MAKKNPILLDTTLDFLIKPKEELSAKLTERIAQGNEIHKKVIQNKSELQKFRIAANLWHNYNSELLRRSFDRTDNVYLKEYIEEINYYGKIVEGNTPLERSIKKLKTDLSTYIHRIRRIKQKLDLIDELPKLNLDIQKTENRKGGLFELEGVFSKFHRIAQSLKHRHADRRTLLINDEYDVQDLLRSLLHLHFDDIREEDYSPSYAGGNSRIDFVLKGEKIVIEVKMTNDRLKDKEIGSQLLIDIGRYRAHPECKTLVVFVYDKADHIRNKTGLKNDLERTSAPDLSVKVYINPL
jgi:hypothetical protein